MSNLLARKNIMPFLPPIDCRRTVRLPILETCLSPVYDPRHLLPPEFIQYERYEEWTSLMVQIREDFEGMEQAFKLELTVEQKLKISKNIGEVLKKIKRVTSSCFLLDEIPVTPKTPRGNIEQIFTDIYKNLTQMENEFDKISMNNKCDMVMKVRYLFNLVKLKK